MVTHETLLQAALTASSGHARRPAGPPDHVDGVEPAVVIEPASVSEVASTLAWASTSNLSVVLRGAGTKASWGRPPERVDVLLTFGHLNRVLAHEASDLTATIEAGARLVDVNGQLAAHGQCLPLDPPHADRATIGGILATNDTGPWRHRYGTPRDQLIGMTVVMADGTIAKSGGRVVKNVAGYDIGRLMTGSHGSLAAIVSATFKLSPLPPVSRTMRVLVPRASDVLAFTDMLRQHQCEPEALEVHVSRRGPTDRIAVMLRYGSVGTAVDAACQQTEGYARQLDATVESAEGDDAVGWWSAHQNATPAAGCPTLRLSWKPAEFERAADALTRATRGVDLDWIGRAAVGSGTVAVGGDPALHAAVVTALRSSGIFSHVVVVDAPVSLRTEADVWQIPGPQQMLWQALKNSCDPRQTLGAGRGPL